MVVYSILNTKNPCYNELRTKKLELLYKGGDDLISNSNLFIPQESHELTLAYQSRLRCASYKNYLAQIINDYVSNLFSKSLSVLPQADADDESTPGELLDQEGDGFYRKFASNADLQRHPVHDVLRDVLTESLISGRAYLGIDFPNTDGMHPQSLLEEEIIGASRAYTYCIPTLSMIDWELDDNNNYKFVVLKKETVIRNSLFDKRDKKVIQFKVWTKDGEVVKYDIYEIVCKIDKQPKDNDEVVLVSSGVVSFPEIPILCLDIPEQLWIGGLIGNLIADHFKRHSSLIFAQNRNLFALPVYKQGAELPANGDLSEKGTDPNRGNSIMSQMKLRGFAVIGPEDEIEFKEPAGTSYELINTELKELVDDIYRVVNQMANSVSAQQTSKQSSGLSKVMDNHSKEMVLSAYASEVKQFAIKLYYLISTARKENIIWQALGMTDYRIVDKQVLLQELMSNAQVNQAIPSKTWHKNNAQRLAFELDNNLTPELQLTIKKEIDEYYEKMPDEQLTMTPSDRNNINNPELSSSSASSPERSSNVFNSTGLVGRTKPKPTSANINTSSASSNPADSSASSGDPATMHLRGQSSAAGIAQTVYNQLAEDYPKDIIQWVLAANWTGPLEIPLESIDFSNKSNWQASKDDKKVDKFVDAISNDGFEKPIILVNEANDNKLMIVDGHHRALAYEKLGEDPMAYVAHVGSVGGPWNSMHRSQNGQQQSVSSAQKQEK